MNKLRNLVVAAVFVVPAVSVATARAAGSNDMHYQVLPGDNLSRIAARYHTTVRAFLQANPQITNPNLIFPGVKLLVPRQAKVEPSIIVSPDNGPAGTRMEVSVNGFPSNSNVELSHRHPAGPQITS